MNDLISRKALLAEYDRVHIGEPGQARKLIENAPAVDAPHWATEQAYKNGYEAGKKDALNGVGISNLETATKWIPVSERLPDKDGHYVCCYHFGEYPRMTFTQVLDYYATDIVPHFQHTLGDGSMKVTHWMPLPEPPKGE